jgi:ATPase family associated with various cellular activities (AAA)
MTYFLKNGNTYRISAKEALDLHEALPAGNYIIKENPMSGELFLEHIGDFEIKGKTYGDHTRNADRILRTFMDRPNTTGVMLTGEKGSGKSLLAKQVSINGAKKNIPTIVINAPWHGDKFNSFIQTIEQECIVLFDEFEKTYDSNEQEAILTLLDGVFPSKKLFMLTCNDKWRVDQNMRNRPGRIYYMIDFKGLDAAFIREYCQDNLKAKKHTDKIVQIASLFSQFNFDMLKALVEEMNRYNESPEEVLSMLNAKPEFDQGDNRYKVDLSLNGIPLDSKGLKKQEWKGNPLQSTIQINYKEYETDNEFDVIDSDNNDWEWGDLRFTPQELKKIDSDGGKFIFVDDDGNSLTLTKIIEKKTYYYDAF